MKRFSHLLLSVAFFLQVPAASAAYDSPGDLLKAVRADTSPRALTAEGHLSYAADDAFYLSFWMRGRSQGELAHAEAESSFTVDIVVPSQKVNTRIKGRVRITEQNVYGLLESINGELGDGNEEIKASVQEVAGKWVSMKIDPALVKESGIDYSELFDEDLLRMERTQGKDGSMYSVTVDREILRGFLSLVSSLDSSLETASPLFHFHTVVTTDHEERVKNTRMYLSLQIPDLSFVFQGSNEALPDGFTVRVPENAIPIDTMIPSVPEGGSATVPTDPRAAGTDKYDARAAARALRQMSVKKPVSAQIRADALSFGEESAPVTITEYTDYECPFCRHFHMHTYPLIKKGYIDTGKVRFVIKQYPLSFHPGALPAAMAVQCALDQGNALGQRVSDAMWILQEAGNELNETHIMKYAGMFSDLDYAQFSDCFKNDKKQDEIDLHMGEGNDAGVTGTPAFILHNRSGGTATISGAMPYERFREEIDALLK